MTGLITKAAIGTTLMIMFVSIAFLFMVQMGNEYDVELGQQYDGRFGVTLQNDNVVTNNSISPLVANSSSFQEGGDLDTGGFDAAQSPGSVSAAENLLNVRDVVADFAADFQAVGFAFSPIIIYSLLTILAIGLMISFAYIFFKVMP